MNATSYNPHVTWTRLRKLLHLGNSYAVTIPTGWVRMYSDPKLPYVTTRLQPDGSIVLRPYDPTDPTGEQWTQPPP
jgi:hypothetical protein